MFLLRRLSAMGLLLGSLEHVLHHLHLQAAAQGDGGVAWRPRSERSLASDASCLKEKADCTFEHFGHFSLVGVEPEGREEAQGAQVECHDRRHAALQRNTPSAEAGTPLAWGFESTVADSWSGTFSIYRIFYFNASTETRCTETFQTNVGRIKTGLMADWTSVTWKREEA